ncbi:hypothetical protein GCM10017083_46830 [Thalassobaculum fulvum]|uniref:Methyltransferase domain-containing protein n=1 Tax=Thalassobaculum fulvum TaxID=1633335 RepID=A0A919CT47_9PROT|nr:class I SAM-dependent methyltransferase [Thalassobaculum fulvum]GHD60651.1 hypothetical protein GCM10017083_46830 [Thalassobaculum fulvum]
MNPIEVVIAGPEAVALVTLLAGGLLIVAYALRTGVPPMPTGSGIRAVMLRLLPATVDGTVYDLGSGWGGLAFALARRYPSNRVVGIELSPLPWLFARAMLMLRRYPNLEFRRAELMAASLSDAGAVVCYLMPATMRRLAPKLTAELRPGTPVVAYSFAFDGWPPDAAVLEAESGPMPVYRYTVTRAPTVTPDPGASSPAGT